MLESFRLADLLAALSVVTDLGTGQGPEKAVRACLVATGLARHLGADENEARDVYYTSLLRHLGCTATSHEETFLFGGDELTSRPPAEGADFGNSSEMLSLMMATGKGTGLNRIRYLSRAMRAGKKAEAVLFGSLCEVAARLATRLEMEDAVVDGVYQVFERWDGTGLPRGLTGEEIGLPARLAELAHQVVIFDRIGGSEAAEEVVRQRAGGWYDPGACEAFEQVGSKLLAEINVSDVWQMVLGVEPEPVVTIPDWRLDNVAGAFADMIDLKAPFSLSHSAEVSKLAEGAARELRLDEDEIVAVRRAGFLHDVGRAGVSNAVWEKKGELHSSDWEQVRLHPYYTERVLSRSVALEPLARLAGMHHERQNGSGYHHQASGREISVGSRLLAAADAFQAMTQDRPYRRALSPDQAAEELTSDAAGGSLDPECIRAVLAAAGQDQPPRSSWPAGLSDREVEVLRLVAKGMSNKEIAENIFVSPRTAEHHVQHIYAKVGVSTRAGAAMYAMENDLIRT